MPYNILQSTGISNTLNKLDFNVTRDHEAACKFSHRAWFWVPIVTLISEHVYQNYEL
jgi:hypothetical protein